MFVCVIKMSMCQEMRAKYYLFSRIIEKNDSLNTTKAVRVVRPWEFMAKGLDFWAWPLEASQCARPKARILKFHQLFLSHFLGLSTKFVHSTPRPLDLDIHNEKPPQDRAHASPSAPNTHTHTHINKGFELLMKKEENTNYIKTLHIRCCHFYRLAFSKLVADPPLS